MNTLEDVRQRIVQGGLLDRDELDAVVAGSQFNDGEALLGFLVQEQRLSEFQAQALIAGLTGPFMLGPYQMNEQIVVGRLGTVFRALHVEFDQPVSLKVFSKSLARHPEQLARMRREARVAAQTDHPNILRALQIGRVGETYYLALEDLRGETLEARLARRGRLPAAEACRLIRHAAQGLESLHEAEIIHRDVRPANLWINQSEQIKLMEFGAAHDALSFLDRLDNEEALTRQETVLGDFHYSPPETVRDARAAGPGSDVYSLGCTLFHALAGQPPFVHKNPLSVMQMHATEPPRPLDLQVPGIPRGLADIVDRMLAKSPEERPGLNEVDWALQPFDNNSPVVSTAAEQVWNPEYLAWVREVNQIEPVTAGEIEVEAEGSDELTEFLEWIISNQSER